jgi:hypothetical protein
VLFFWNAWQGEDHNCSAVFERIGCVANPRPGQLELWFAPCQEVQKKHVRAGSTTVSSFELSSPRSSGTLDLKIQGLASVALIDQFVRKFLTGAPEKKRP